MGESVGNHLTKEAFQVEIVTFNNQFEEINLINIILKYFQINMNKCKLLQ